jgi:hypothetical protein
MICFFRGDSPEWGWGSWTEITIGAILRINGSVHKRRPEVVSKCMISGFSLRAFSRIAIPVLILSRFSVELPLNDAISKLEVECQFSQMELGNSFMTCSAGDRRGGSVTGCFSKRLDCQEFFVICITMWKSTRGAIALVKLSDTSSNDGRVI